MSHCHCCKGQYIAEVRGTGTPSSVGALTLYDCPGVDGPEALEQKQREVDAARKVIKELEDEIRWLKAQQGRRWWRLSWR